MNNDLLLASRFLGKGAIQRLHDVAGRRVECLSGALWLTQDGDRRDIVLQVGGGFTIPAATDVLISGLADTRYALLDPIGRSTGSAP